MSALSKAAVVTACIIAATNAFGQTPLMDAAAVFNNERKVTALSTISKDQAKKQFSPYLKESPDSAAFVVAAFTLAMKGVDVDKNLARLVIPIKDSHDDKIEELVAAHGLAQNQILLEDIPGAIYTIYKTRHYEPALKTLLTMPVEWPAAEYRDDCIMAQLHEDPRPVLTLAAADKQIYATLWDIVDWNVGSMTDRKIFVRRMQSAHWSTRSMKQTALRLARDVATPKNRPSK